LGRRRGLTVGRKDLSRIDEPCHRKRGDRNWPGWGTWGGVPEDQGKSGGKKIHVMPIGGPFASAHNLVELVTAETRSGVFEKPIGVGGQKDGTAQGKARRVSSR